MATEADFSDSNLMRTEFLGGRPTWGAFGPDNLDQELLWQGADLRGCSLRGARFDRTSFRDATFGKLDATGASGTVHECPASVETADGLRPLSPEEMLEYLRAAGADVSFWQPSATS